MIEVWSAYSISEDIFILPEIELFGIVVASSFN